MRHPEWCYDAVLYELNVRQFTPEGTLRAAAGRLPFLRELGIDALWLMPVHPIGLRDRKGSMGSCYSIRDYCAVNPDLGTEADFDAFVAEAHALGMRVLLDWVANHTARDARWIDERPADWYRRDASGQPLVPWDWSDTAQLNYDNPAVWQGQIDAMKYWVERHAVDGFRCDMAMLMPTPFWQEVSRQLHAVRSDIFLLAEAEEPDHFDRAFDACYGWRTHHLLNDVAAQRCRIPVLRDHLYAEECTWPAGGIKLQFTSNHDENSWNGTEYARMGAAAGIMAALTFLLPQGMPLIYTGQEVGYDHSFAFFERDPIPAEAYRTGPVTELYRRLIALKHNAPALAAGDRGGRLIEIRNNAEDCLMVLVREVAGSCVVALLNLSPYTIHADFLTGIYAGRYTDALTGRPAELPARVERDMAGWEFSILVR